MNGLTYSFPTISYRNKPLVMVTGASGKLGSEVRKNFTDALTPSHEELPVEDREKVGKYIAENLPDIIIHLAAMVSPPKCEIDKKKSWDITVQGTVNIIDACETFDRNCYFVLMSTPCVFSGDNDVEKDEDYLPYPDSFYGLCKAMQEMVVARSKLKWLIIRSNFIPRVKYPFPRAFTDRKSYYLFADQLAEEIKNVVNKKMSGIVHITGDKLLSMYDLARYCPDSKDVKKMTLGDYYKENPNACKLTKSMILVSKRIPKVKFR